MPGTSWWSVLFLMSRSSISYSDADSWLFITISANHTRICEPFTSQPHGIPPQHGRLSLRHASGPLQWNALIARWKPLNISWPTCLHCGPCSLSHIMPLALTLLLGLLHHEFPYTPVMSSSSTPPSPQYAPVISSSPASSIFPNRNPSVDQTAIDDQQGKV